MARRWQISTSPCSIAWGCMWIHSATAMARSKTSSFPCRYRRGGTGRCQVNEAAAKRRPDRAQPQVKAVYRNWRAGGPDANYRRRLMDWRRIAGLSLLIFGLAAASVAAEKPSLADAAEQRDSTL